MVWLWSGSPTQTHKAKVAWEDLCCPKYEGGLGIPKFCDSSKVFALSLIWRIFSNSDSLWVYWIQHYLLRQNSFWDIREDGKGSWIWRKLLKLRPLAYQFIQYEINDTHTAFFWFDDWLQMGKFMDITGAVGTYYLGVARTARVSEAATHQRWNIKVQRSRHFHALHDRIQNERVPLDEHGRDVVLWKHTKDTYKTHFSSSTTWDQIRARRDKLIWSKSVWFPQEVPRYSFIVWLAIKDRLSTGVRMRAWGIQKGCLMCGERDESRDHILFAGPFTYTVWNRLVSRLCGSRINPDWSLTLQFVISNTLSSMDKILIKMLFQTFIYYMWKERNDRRHQKGYRSTEQAVRIIDKVIRNRISSFRYKPGHKLAGLLQRWFEIFFISHRIIRASS